MANQPSAAQAQRKLEVAPAPASPVVTSASRATLTLSSALASTLRLWLIYRDEALWAFCSGVDEPLAALDLTQCESSVIAANQSRAAALAFAKRISEEEGAEGRSPNTVLRDAITSLLSTDSPRFLLSLPDIPGSF